MNKKVKGAVILFVMAIGLVINFIMPVTAEGSNNILDGKEWTASFNGSGSGSITTIDSSAFVADMTSIGTQDWDATYSLTGVELENNSTYVYTADITSDKERKYNFTVICPNSNTCEGGLYPFGTVDLDANKTYKLRKVFTTDTNYSNATLHFGFGHKNYDVVPVNSSNKIEVSNIKLVKIEDYDFNLDREVLDELTYINIPVSTSGYDNYSYANYLNINEVKTETRSDIGKDTLAVSTSGGNIDSNRIYLNGSSYTPIVVEDGWFHVDYATLVNEYNVISTISNIGNICTVVIKNENITDAKAQILEDLDTNYRMPHQDSSDAVKQIIEDAALEITNAQTVAEAQAIYDAVGNKITLQEHKETRSQDVSEAGANTNEEIEAIVAQAISDIAEATSIAAVDSIADTAIETIEAKKEEIVNAKTAATTEIDELIGENPSIAVTTLANAAKSAINDATSVDAVNRILNEAKNSITLQKTKESAIAEIDESIGENPSDAVKTIADKAIAAINRAESKEEVQSILEKALKDIKTQQDSENQKEESNDNPVTLDNILKYFLVLFIGTIGLLTLNNKKVLKRSR